MTEILTRKLEVIGEELERKIALKMADAMLTKPEVAKHFGVSVRTLENWMTRGCAVFTVRKGCPIQSRGRADTCAEAPPRLPAEGVKENAVIGALPALRARGSGARRG